MGIARVLLLAIFFACTVPAQAQDGTDLLKTLPKTKKEFVASEPKLLQAIDWLEQNPVRENDDARTVRNAYVIAWLTNSPTVTVEVNASVFAWGDKNPQLLGVFLGGWARYSIRNNYSKDVVAGSTAGLRSVINCYKLGGDVVPAPELDKIKDLDDAALEQWVREALKKK